VLLLLCYLQAAPEDGRSLEACREAQRTFVVFPLASCLDGKPLSIVLVPSQGRMLFEINARRWSWLEEVLRKFLQARDQASSRDLL
jgi:hypothetical protein